MAENCVDCGKDVGTFWGKSRLHDGDYCNDCWKKRNPPVKECPECSRLMLKRYRGRLRDADWPPNYNFNWKCQCGYEERDVDSLKYHYIDQLLSLVNEERDE